MRLSVALVTRNRPDSVERALVSLREQDVQPWEVVVSDDSDDEQADATRAVAERHDCRYTRGPRRGLYANRNHVALQCRGTHIRTMDDDHAFPPGHFASCRAAVERDPGAVWIIGETLPERVDFGDGYLCPPQLHPRGFSVRPDGDGCWALADGASIYPREIFDRGQRYIEDFWFGASYLEWGSRLHWLGYTIRHLRETYVIHYGHPRVHSDPTGEMASRFFAMMAHDVMYQPTLRNRVAGLAEVAKQLAAHPRTAPRALRVAYGVFRRHRQALR